MLPHLVGSRTRFSTRLLWGAATLVSAAALAVVPTTAQAAPSHPGATGLHDGMMPADSPDAKQAGGTAAGARAGAVPQTQRQAQAQVATGPLLGVDVSSHQHPSGAPIDWTQVASSGQSFAIVKATELWTDTTTTPSTQVPYVNPSLQQDLSGAEAAGLVVGTYAYAHPENPAVAQADNFAAAIGTLPPGSLPPVLDLEETGGLGVTALTAWTQTFLQRLEGDTGILPMIYTSPNFWSTYLGNSTAFTSYPLWEAHYTTAAAPLPVGGWGSNYTLWQYTSAASVPGIVGSVDQDKFNGTASALTAAATAVGPQAIADRTADPATSTSLGAATSSVVCGPASGGCRQTFANNASIYWSPPTGAHIVRGGIRVHWNDTGAESGYLGYPVTDEISLAAGAASVFQGGAIYWSPATGPHAVHGGIRVHWNDTGAESGYLGYPVTEEIALAAGAASVFQGGAIYWSPATGPHAVHGAIRTRWNATGAESGYLGYPVTDEIPLAAGAASVFQGGSIYWSSATGAHAVHGAIRTAWLARGGETGALGYPTTDEYAVPGGARSNFRGGSITWSPKRGAVVSLY